MTGRVAPQDGRAALPGREHRAGRAEQGVKKTASAAIKAAHPRNWELWTLRSRVIVFLAIWEPLTLLLVVWGIAISKPTTTVDWIRFASLAACATAHIQLTRRQEERRRNRLTTVFIDLTGIWIFPAALLLPMSLTLLLIVLVGGQRWFNWRRPPHRFLFTSLTTAAAAAAAHWLFGVLDPTALSTLRDDNSVAEFGYLFAAGFVYATIQALAVAAVLALSNSVRPTLRAVFGTRTDNLLDAGTVGLGAINAVLLVYLPPAIVVLVLVSVLGNRLAEISQLQDDAQTDAKTGLLNMRGWSESAARAFERTRRAGDRVALLMIDLDYFKWINDTYGHPAGDEVILAVGRLLQKIVRPVDIVGRFGGEEFVVLLLDTEVAAAERAAERVRTAIADLRIRTTGRRGAPTTITNRTTSIGVAVYPDHGNTVDELLHAADSAVYEAKENGRNQVRFAVSGHQGNVEHIRDHRDSRPSTQP
ncbi:sensor domain-containing diguanylate cyclase [Haloechinothrix halophila]|uniref:sensor domain-containing diguanylate cyclase n=1 Tax=Haloechinothrix halophila TaxID=1069073 RepID=UPI0009FF7534|nr:GGDEF domain-containing protein [Haloechinothrix halophila]